MFNDSRKYSKVDDDIIRDAMREQQKVNIYRPYLVVGTQIL